MTAFQQSFQMKNFGANMMGAQAEQSYAATTLSREPYYPPGTGDFAPDIEKRILTKTTTMTSEVERGTFHTAAEQVKSLITTSGAYLLNENLNTFDVELKKYYQATYEIKVETSRYAAILTQLKQIGKIMAFHENTLDITGQRTNLQTQLETEQARLERYKQLYIEAQNVEDKINLNDRIFSQEQTIKYLQEALKNIDQRVDYSTLYLTLTEKRSEYADVTFVKLSGMVRSFIRSLNSVIWLAVVLIPWAVLYWIIRSFYKRSTRRK